MINVSAYSTGNDPKSTYQPVTPADVLTNNSPDNFGRVVFEKCLTNANWRSDKPSGSFDANPNQFASRNRFWKHPGRVVHEYECNLTPDDRSICLICRMVRHVQRNCRFQNTESWGRRHGCYKENYKESTTKSTNSKSRDQPTQISIPLKHPVICLFPTAFIPTLGLNSSTPVIVYHTQTVSTARLKVMCKPRTSKLWLGFRLEMVTADARSAHLIISYAKKFSCAATFI